MKVDNYGLVHGGFVFGLADYAAMLAVNEPTVVLGKAETSFLKPVIVGVEIIASATISRDDGKKKVVLVDVVDENNEIVFKGTFHCYVPTKHILNKNVF